MESNLVVKSQETFKSNEAKFNHAFEIYIKAVERQATCKSGKPAKTAMMLLGRAEKNLRKVDQEFADRFLAQVEEERMAKIRARHEVWMKENGLA